MLYEMRCDLCKREIEIGCPISQHEYIIKPGMLCKGSVPSVLGCAGTLRQFHKNASIMVIDRSPFPGTGNEVQLPTHHGEDMNFRDKSEARDWLGERGLTSKWIENDM